jgi:hypothetical protein
MSQPENRDNSLRNGSNNPSSGEENSEDSRNSKATNSSQNSPDDEENPFQGDDLSWMEDMTDKPGPGGFGITGMSMPRKRSKPSDEQSTDITKETEQDILEEGQD